METIAFGTLQHTGKLHDFTVSLLLARFELQKEEYNYLCPRRTHIKFLPKPVCSPRMNGTRSNRIKTVKSFPASNLK